MGRKRFDITVPGQKKVRIHRDKNIINFRDEQIERQIDDNGNRRVRYAPPDYTEVTDDEDDGSFPHRLHIQCPNFKILSRDRKEQLRQEGFKIREGKFR